MERKEQQYHSLVGITTNIYGYIDNTTNLNTRLWFSNTSFLMFINLKYTGELELIFLHYGTRYETIGLAYAFIPLRMRI